MDKVFLLYYEAGCYSDHHLGVCGVFRTLEGAQAKAVEYCTERSDNAKNGYYQEKGFELMPWAHTPETTSEFGTTHRERWSAQVRNLEYTYDDDEQYWIQAEEVR